MSTTPTVIGRGPRLIDWRIVRFSMIFLLGSCMPQYALHRFAIYESSEVNTTLQQRGDIREISPGVKFSVMKVNGKAYKLFQLLFWMKCNFAFAFRICHVTEKLNRRRGLANSLSGHGESNSLKSYLSTHVKVLL